jgi:hypothetical protein
MSKRPSRIPRLAWIAAATPRLAAALGCGSGDAGAGSGARHRGSDATIGGEGGGDGGTGGGSGTGNGCVVIPRNDCAGAPGVLTEGTWIDTRQAGMVARSTHRQNQDRWLAAPMSCALLAATFSAVACSTEETRETTGSAGGRPSSSSGNGGEHASTSTSGGVGGADGGGGTIVYPDKPCVLEGGCKPDEWVPVTPARVELVEELGCGNFGTKSVQVDPSHPEVLYTMFFCQGVWRSTDYGQTWNGPINTGSNAEAVTDCAGLIAVPPKATVHPLPMYVSCIRGSGTGFWKSTDRGVNWKSVVVEPASDAPAGQQFYPPTIDPYDANHLLMAGHAEDLIVESLDGGETWRAIPIEPGMAQMGGTSGLNFIDTGDAATTRNTWLWMAAQTENVGTWRTTNAGAEWTQVETNSHVSGATQIYQAGSSAVIYAGGVYSQQGWGVLRSDDYGKTWAHVGQPNLQEAIVLGTTKRVYAMYGYAVGATGTTDPSLQVADQPGTGTWTMPGTPAEMFQGPAQGAVTFDGTNNIVLTANYNAGLWRYVEP